MKYKCSVIITSFAVVTLATGCAGLGTKKRNQGQIDKIKKVALVAYTANLPASSSIALSGGSGKLEGTSGSSMITENSPETERMFVAFAQALQKNQRWNVIDPKAMMANSGYRAAYKNTMEGWQNKMPAGRGIDYNVPNVMDWNGLRLLKFDGREKLMVELGADALAMLRVDVSLEGFTVAGIGPRKPKARAHIEIFSKGVEEPVWFETFEGEESKESVGTTAFFDDQKVKQLSLISAETAYSKINSKIQ